MLVYKNIKKFKWQLFKFGWQLFKFGWQLFSIPVSNFLVFYEHNQGDTPYNGIYGGAQKGVPFSDIRSIKG